MSEFEAKSSETAPVMAPDPESSPQFDESQWRDNPRPPAPGGLPVTVDTIILNFLQLALTATNVLVIMTSFTYDGDDLGWIVLAEVLILLIGFAFYMKYLCKNILIWDIFRKMDDWHSDEYSRWKSGDSTACNNWRFLLVAVVWWLHRVLVFPVIIAYSAYLSYSFYKNLRSDTNTDVTRIDFESADRLDVAEQNEYISHSLNAFSVSYLGFLSKQAAMLMLFIQDIPFLIIGAVITNYIALIVFPISILYKIVNWTKYMFDVKGCRCFYKYEDFWDNFQLFEVKWVEMEDVGLLAPFVGDLKSLVSGAHLLYGFDENQKQIEGRRYGQGLRQRAG